MEPHSRTLTIFRAGPIACARPGQTLDLVAAGHKNQTSSLVRFEHGCFEP